VHIKELWQNRDKKTIRNMSTKYEFTSDESNPNRIAKIELELVDFTLKITQGNGEESFIVEPDRVQKILDEAHRFNSSVIEESTSSGIDANIVKKARRFHCRNQAGPCEFNQYFSYSCIVNSK